MGEPDVQIFLQEIQDLRTRGLFDQIRRWFQFRKDVLTPAIQTFEGVISEDDEIKLYVPGKVVGYSGMCTKVGSTPLVWLNMVYSDVTLGDRPYFGFENENFDGNYVTLRLNVGIAGANSFYRVSVSFL